MRIGKYEIRAFKDNIIIIGLMSIIALRMLKPKGENAPSSMSDSYH